MLGARSTDFYLNPPNTAFSKKQEHENIRIHSRFIFRLLTKHFWHFSILFQTIFGILASCFQCLSPVNKEKLIKQLSHNQRTKT